MNERVYNVERLVHRACEILEKRATDPNRSVEQRMAYNSALCMVLYALGENEECLNQFDY